MNRSIPLGLALCLPMAASAGQTKVELCHEGQTISVAQPAVAAHLAHGDAQVACNGVSLDLLYSIDAGISDNTVDHTEVTEGGDEVVDLDSTWVRVAEVRDELMALQQPTRVVDAPTNAHAAIALLELSLDELVHRIEGRAATYAADAIFEIYNSSTLSTGDQGPYWGHNGGWINNGRGIQTCSLTFPEGVQATLLLNSRASGRTSPCTALGEAYDGAWTL
jgi:hypothetical protein